MGVSVFCCHAYEKMIRCIIFECRAHSESEIWRSLNLVRTSPEHLRNASRRRSMRLVRGTGYCDNNQITKLIG